MAIAFDAFTDNSDIAPATSATFAHTCTGSNRGIVVSNYLQDIGASISTVTYNGDSLAQVAIGTASLAGGGGRTLKQVLYYLANPDTGGAYNVVVTGSESSSNGFANRAVSYTGVDQATMEDDSEKATNASTSTISPTALTSNDAGDWAVTGVVFENGGTADSTNYVGRNDAGSELGDSNTTVGTGSITVTATGTSGAALIVSMLIKPAGAGGSVNSGFFQFM